MIDYNIYGFRELLIKANKYKKGDLSFYSERELINIIKGGIK